MTYHDIITHGDCDQQVDQLREGVLEYIHKAYPDGGTLLHWHYSGGVLEFVIFNHKTHQPERISIERCAVASAN